MDKLNTNEWLLSHLSKYFGLSYSRVRGIIKDLQIEPKRYLRNQPVYTQKHVRQIEDRNTKPGPKRKEKLTNNKGESRWTRIN